MINACVQTWSRRGERRRSLKKGNRKKRQTSVILVIFLGTKEAFLATGSLVPQWRFDATRLELDSNELGKYRREKNRCVTRCSSTSWKLVSPPVSQSASQVADRLLSYGTRNGFTGVCCQGPGWSSATGSATFLCTSYEYINKPSPLSPLDKTNTDFYSRGGRRVLAG